MNDGRYQVMTAAEMRGMIDRKCIAPGPIGSESLCVHYAEQLNCGGKRYDWGWWKGGEAPSHAVVDTHDGWQPKTAREGALVRDAAPTSVKVKPAEMECFTPSKPIEPPPPPPKPTDAEIVAAWDAAGQAEEARPRWHGCRAAWARRAAWVRLREGSIPVGVGAVLTTFTEYQTARTNELRRRNLLSLEQARERAYAARLPARGDWIEDGERL